MAEYDNEQNQKIRQLEAEINTQKQKARYENIRRENAEKALERAQRASSSASSASAASAASEDIPPEPDHEEVDGRLAHLTQSNGDDDGHESSAFQTDTSNLHGELADDQEEPFQDLVSEPGIEFLPPPDEDDNKDESDSGDENVSACNASSLPQVTITRPNTGRSEGRISLPVIRLRRKSSKKGHKRVMTVPLEPWCPATRVVNPIARTCFTVNSKPKECDPFETDCDQDGPTSIGL